MERSGCISADLTKTLTARSAHQNGAVLPQRLPFLQHFAIIQQILGKKQKTIRKSVERSEAQAAYASSRPRLTAALLPSVRAVRSGLLCPKDPMTRCELALVPARAVDLVQVS